MKRIEIQARAKINLSLDILGKRPDGYHEVEMIMQSIALNDLIELEETEKGIRVITDHPLLKEGEKNIVYKTARLLAERYKINKGLKIKITKNIPVAAGLAGGSSDAAAVLKGLNIMWNLKLTSEQLAVIGSEVGSDVPFCIKGGTALAKGRGEVLTPLAQIPETWLVLAKPPVEVSTAETYQNFHIDKVQIKPPTKLILDSIESGDMETVAVNMANVLESVTLTKYPEVSLLKAVMNHTGLINCLMSGSGPSVFGIARNRQEAENAAEAIKNRMPAAFVTVTKTSSEF